MSAIRVVEVVGNSEGGGARFVASLLGRLDPARYTTTLVSPDAHWLRDLCAQCGIAYRPLPLMASRMSRSLGRDFDTILQEAQPQLVHAHGTRAAWFTARRLPTRTARRQRPAFLYSEHLFSFDARRGVARLPWYAIERYICQRADLLTTSCRANAARALRARWTTAERVALDHYGIDLPAIRAQATRPYTRGELGLSADGVLMGSIGRLIPQKGFGDLLDGLALALPRYPHVTCLIVGDGPLRGALERQCRALGLERQVHFVGAHQEPWRILALCEVVALSSLFDGLALTLLEALAAGVPVVTTNAGGAEEVVTSGQNGLVVPPGNPRALAAGIERMLGDQQLRAACRANGPPSVQSYDAEVALKQVLSVYEALTAQARRSV